MKVSEVFESISGEGLTIGYPALFVRMAGCNLNCEYCDTPQRNKIDKYWTSINVLDKIIEVAERRKVLVITGGEPMCQENAVKLIAMQGKAEGMQVVMQTNGSIMPEKRLKEVVDIWEVSPKLYLPLKAVQTIMCNWKLQVEKLLFKWVVDIDSQREVSRVRRLVLDNYHAQKIDSLEDIVLQPKVICGNDLTKKKLRKLAQFAMQENIRLLPQWHKFLGVD